MSDRIVRKWYLKHDAMIPSLVDSHFLIEELSILDVLKTETIKTSTLYTYSLISIYFLIFRNETTLCKGADSMMLHRSETSKKMDALEPAFCPYLDLSSHGGPFWGRYIKKDSPQEAKEAFAEWCRLKVIHEKEEDELCGGFAH